MRIEPLLIVQGVLVLALGGTLLAALKALQRIERIVLPIGARRVHFSIPLGEAFPIEELPDDVAARAAKGTALFIYLGPNCCLCEIIVDSLPFLAEDYTDVNFIILSRDEWSPFVSGRRAKRVDLVANLELVRMLRLQAQPYVVKTVDGKVRDFGVVNTPEHVESLLESS